MRADTDTRSRVFDSRFRTLKTSLDGAFLSPPVMRLGTDDHIIINFDEIGEDNSYLQCRLVHCNADWQPSSLTEGEYLESFNFADIEDYAFSSNTFVHYVNYHIEIPNEHLRPTRSGNYLLQVYDPDSPDDVLLQTRFMVSENVAPISGFATSRTDRGHYSDWQQLEFRISTDGLDIRNPYTDLLVEVRQNGRDDSARILRAPSRLEGKTLIYSHQNELIWPASNEYRRFESISNLFPGINVDSVRWGGTNYQVYLREDLPRSDKGYEFDRTQHGRFIVREYNATDSNIGADYITVHFTLNSPLLDSPVFIEGEFTGGLADSRYRMTYSPDRRVYEAAIPLKQGAYNYQYVTLNPSSGKLDPAPIEGNKYETENEYTVAVYHRPPGERADRLLNVSLLPNL